jgi:hypothetical protein
LYLECPTRIDLQSPDFEFQTLSDVSAEPLTTCRPSGPHATELTELQHYDKSTEATFGNSKTRHCGFEPRVPSQGDFAGSRLRIPKHDCVVKTPAGKF